MAKMITPILWSSVTLGSLCGLASGILVGAVVAIFVPGNMPLAMGLHYGWLFGLVLGLIDGVVISSILARFKTLGTTKCKRMILTWCMGVNLLLFFVGEVVAFLWPERFGIVAFASIVGAPMLVASTYGASSLIANWSLKQIGRDSLTQ